MCKKISLKKGKLSHINMHTFLYSKGSLFQMEKNPPKMNLLFSKNQIISITTMTSTSEDEQKLVECVSSSPRLPHGLQSIDKDI
jgi:hypothetical protein